MRKLKITSKPVVTFLSLVLPITLIPFCPLFSNTVNAASNVAINSTNFPDPVFRNYVSEMFDADNNGSLSSSEIKDATIIDMDDSGLTDLKGIEYFTALEYLSCGYNDLITLDVSKNIELESIYCYSNHLTTLDVSRNLKLYVLCCWENQLTTLDVSYHTALHDLDCSYNELTTLDVTGCVNLETLYVSDNNLKTLDIDTCTSLINVYCSKNYLTERPQVEELDFDPQKLKVTRYTKSYTGLVGSTATLSVTVAGSGLSYQWQVYSNGTWVNSGANGSKTSSISFVVTKDHNNKQYRCVIKDSYGQKITSNPATIYVESPIRIEQPSDFTGAIGDTATFSLKAYGEGLKYQWQVFTNGVWRNSGATGAKTNKITFKINSAHNGTKYRCIVTNALGNSQTSREVTLFVGTPLTITKQPTDYYASAGSTASFSVTAQGDGLTYQWQICSDGVWRNSGASGAKTPAISFRVTNDLNGKKYRCVVTDKNGNSVTSNSVTLSVTGELTITKQPVNYLGEVGSVATFSVAAQGEDLTYQWQMYSNGAWKNSAASGAKTPKISFKVTDNHNGMKYRCVIKNKNGKTVTSNAAVLYVGSPVSISEWTSSYKGKVGSTAKLSVTAKGDGLTYQWQVYSGGVWKNSAASGAKTSKISFTITSSHNNMKYRCVVRDKYGYSVISPEATVYVV